MIGARCDDEEISTSMRFQGFPKGMIPHPRSPGEPPVIRSWGEMLADLERRGQKLHRQEEKQDLIVRSYENPT